MARQLAASAILTLLLACLCGACGVDGQLFLHVPRDDNNSDAGTAGDGDGGLIPRTSPLASGEYRSCAIVAKNSYCWGGSVDADEYGRITPERLPLAEPAVKIAVGLGHVCALSAAGNVYCSPPMREGDTVFTLAAPSLVRLPAPALDVAVHENHSCAITADHALYCWGSNEEGQLGLPEGAPQFVEQPSRVGADRDWAQVAPGQGHTCGLKISGALYCWGRNTGGHLALGEGAEPRVYTPAAVPGKAEFIWVSSAQAGSCAVRASGALLCWGENTAGQRFPAGFPNMLSSPTLISSSTDWTRVEASTFHTCALKRDHSLHCFGRNAEGQLGSGEAVPHSEIITVRTLPSNGLAIGRFHTCLAAQGDVLCAGKNDAGQLGIGNRGNHETFVSVKLP